MKTSTRALVGSIITLSLLAVGGIAAAQSNFDDFGGGIFDNEVSVDLKVNRQEGPVTVSPGTRIVVSWTSEGASRCRGNWSRNDIKPSGTISGRISRSVVIKVACVDREGNRADDSVIVNVAGSAQISTPVVTKPVPQPTQTEREQPTPAAVQASFALLSSTNGPGLSLESGYVQYNATFDGRRFDPSAVTLEIQCPRGVEANLPGEDVSRCNKEFRMFRADDGKYSNAVKFTNSTESAQLIGAVARFYGAADKALATDKDALSLPPTKNVAPPSLPLPGAASAQPSITVLSPNGGESYIAGGTILVTWKPLDIPSGTPITVTIESASRGVVAYNYDVSVNDRSSSVVIPLATKSGSDYRAVIGTHIVGTNLAIQDKSDAPFTITAPTSTQLTEKPNLIAGTPEFSGERAGSRKYYEGTFTISSSISNIGSGAVKGIFQNQVQASRDDSTWTDKAPLQDVADLAPGASRNVSYTWKAIPHGQYYVRVCADTGEANLIAETNESDNCSASEKVEIVAKPTTSVPPTAPSTGASAATITVTGPLNSYGAPGNAFVSFTSSGVSRVKVEACVNKTECTAISPETAVSGPSMNVRWDFKGDEPFVGAAGSKPIYLKVTDLDSGVSDFTDSYIYILPPSSSGASAGTVLSSDVWEFLKAFFGGR